MQARSLALQLIGILLLPVLVVAAATALGAGSRPSIFAAIVVGIAGLAVSFTASRPQPGQPDFERRLQSYGNNVARVVALGVATFALLFGANNFRIPLVASVVGILWAMVWLPTGMRRVGIHTSVVIARDQSTVFNFVADERNAPQYIAGIGTVDKITDGEVGIGTQFRVESSPTVMLEQITDFQPPTMLSSSVVSGLRPNREVLTFQAVPEGTLIRHEFNTELTYAGAVAGEGLLRPMMTAQMRARRYAMWGRLKQILETGSAL